MIGAALLYRLGAKRLKVAGLLTTHVEEARKKLYPRRSARDAFLSILSTLYYPSRWSILIPLVLVVLVIAFDLFCSPRWAIKNNDLLSNLISVEAGLTAIIFPLVIFMIELTGDRSETGVKKSEVLLRESLLFPAVIFVLLCLLAFVFLVGASAGISLIIATTIVSITVLFRVITVLLDDHKVIMSGREVLKDKVRRGLHLAITERLANNILVGHLETQKVSPSFFGFDEERDSVHLFPAAGLGTVVDIDLDRLNDFIAEIPEIKPGARIFDEHQSDQKPKRPSIHFTTRLGDTLTEGRTTVLAVERTGELGEERLKVLRSIAREIVTVAPSENYQQILGTEISRLKDFMLSAIDDRRTGAIAIGADHYVAIAETFLEELAKCNSNYSSKRASEEIGSLFGRWDAVEKVGKDVYEFYERALLTNNKAVVKEIAYLPIAISARALRFRDHYLFQRFTIFAKYIYQASLKHSDPEIKEFLGDRAYRHLKELADFHIEPQLMKRKLPPERVSEYGDFALELLSVFQGLMKLSIDTQDLKGLEGFLKEMRELFDRFKPEQEPHRVQMLEMFLGQQNLAINQRADFEAALPIQKRREEVSASIRLRRKQITFGLAAWAFKLWNKDRTQTSHRNAFLLLLRAL